MKLSEQTVSAIARALLNDRKKISEDMAFWNGRIRAGLTGKHYVNELTANLQENANALIELADSIAPWLKQLPDWQSITQKATA